MSDVVCEFRRALVVLRFFGSYLHIRSTAEVVTWKSAEKSSVLGASFKLTRPERRSDGFRRWEGWQVRCSAELADEQQSLLDCGSDMMRPMSMLVVLGCAA